MPRQNPSKVVDTATIAKAVIRGKQAGDINDNSNKANKL